MHHHLKTKIIWFGVGKCYQDHWKKIPILVYIILVGYIETFLFYWSWIFFSKKPHHGRFSFFENTLFFGPPCICFHIRMLFVMHRGTELDPVQQCNTQSHCLHCIVLLRWEQATLNALKLFSFSPLDLDLDRAGGRNIFF